MYDVRGIQKYIYRTQTAKDAMGASALVEKATESKIFNRRGFSVRQGHWGIIVEILQYTPGG